ncbi:hypothetical protein RPHASCH2410_CH19525 [Rhizobium phaseoli Ch24-10]|nr:hypothetical protein RPHASCH2410_CH19525 [Rhizobium phaseoli Ch24-10]
MTYVTIILMPRSASDENQMPINLLRNVLLGHNASLNRYGK